jgi:hypothetical protein
MGKKTVYLAALIPKTAEVVCVDSWSESGSPPQAAGYQNGFISYIFTQISKSRCEAFCSFCSSFLSEAERKIAHCLRAVARVFAI